MKPWLPFLVTAGVLMASTAHADSDPAQTEHDGRCDVLLQQAVAQLAAEQYPRMLKLAEDRMLLCTDPLSSFLVGLAQANMVDSLAVSDPAQREQTRRNALRHLRIAVAGEAALNPRWQYTAHEWIVHLQGLGGPVPLEEPAADLEVYGPEFEDEDTELLEIPPAPPPQPQPVFPWGPLLTGTAGLAALTTGIVMGVTAEDKSDEARTAARQLLRAAEAPDADKEQLAQWARQTRDLHDEATSQRVWANGLMLGGGVGLAIAGAWYWLIPPDGKWRWAVMPTGLRTTVRF
jgi:hypothetical protein